MFKKTTRDAKASTANNVTLDEEFNKTQSSDLNQTLAKNESSEPDTNNNNNSNNNDSQPIDEAVKIDLYSRNTLVPFTQTFQELKIKLPILRNDINIKGIDYVGLESAMFGDLLLKREDAPKLIEQLVAEEKLLEAYNVFYAIFSHNTVNKPEWLETYEASLN